GAQGSRLSLRAETASGARDVDPLRARDNSVAALGCSANGRGGEELVHPVWGATAGINRSCCVRSQSAQNAGLMDFFNYRNGQLYCEDVAAEKIAAEVGTPVYVYSKATFLRHYRQFRDAFAELKPTIC